MTPILGITSSAVVPAIPGSFESIASASGTGSSATITFSSIPGTYQYLQARIVAKSTGTAAGLYVMQVRFNNDATTKYTFHRLYGYTNPAITAAGEDTTTTGTVFNFDDWLVTSNSAYTSITSVAIMDIHDYATTNKYKVAKIFLGANNNTTTSGANRIGIKSDLWLSTSAITRLDFTAGTGNFTTDTTISLYGIKGA